RRQAARALEEPEGNHQGTVEEVADPDRPNPARDPAGGGAPLARRAGVRRTRAVVLEDVGVGVRSAVDVRDREFGQRAAADRGADAEEPAARGADGVVGRESDQDQEREADEADVAGAGPRCGAPAPLPGGRHQRRARRGGGRAGSRAPSRRRWRGRGSAAENWNPPSAQTSAAGRTMRTPASATARSRTVTIPKSRSIRMSETIST